MPCEGPPARHAEGPPWGTARCSGGQRKRGQIKVIKDLRINNAFILDLLTILAESAERREEGAEMDPDPTKRLQIGGPG